MSEPDALVQIVALVAARGSAEIAPQDLAELIARNLNYSRDEARQLIAEAVHYGMLKQTRFYMLTLENN